MPTSVDTSHLDPEKFDLSLEPHILTTKEKTKNVPCNECRRCCVVTTFMAPAKVKCNECSGMVTGKAVGSQAVVQAGKTAPEFARNLADCLINKDFAHAVCPFNPEHRVELKDVSHSPSYGPRRLEGYKNDVPQYKQETGELVLHQCLDCATVIQYTTTHPQQLRRVNEPRISGIKGPGIYESVLGVRDTSSPIPESVDLSDSGV